MTEQSIQQVRRICLRFPEVTERLSHGEPSWFVKDKKLFAMFSDHHHDDRVAFVCAAPPGVQEVLVSSEPLKYYRPPYFWHRGWIGVYLDVEVDWEVIDGILEDAYRTIAPAKLISQMNLST